MSRESRELIQIETEEDVNSVRDRLSRFRGQRIVLVWPEVGTALTRKLDLVLIQREAMRRQIRLAFVTHDAAVRSNAAELNISTFETIGESERKRWKRARSRVFASRSQRPDGSPDHEDLEEVASRKRDRASLSARGLLVRFAALALLAIFAFGLFYAVVPSAIVTLVPATVPIEASVQITVDPLATDVDIENAVLPAQQIRVEIEESATRPTSGTRSLGNIQAIGEVVFINETNGAVEVPVGTLVSTSASAPVMFQTTASTTVPAGVGQEASVTIEAMPSAAGDTGNVAANLINTVIGPLEERVDVINLSPTREGQSRVEAVVTQRDRDRLEGQVNQLLQERAYTEMLALPQITEDQFILVDTIRIVEQRPEWTVFSAEADQIADTLTLTKRVIVEASVVDTALGRQIVFARMAAQLTAMPDMRFDESSVSFSRGDVVQAGDLILFTMSGQAEGVSRIDASRIRQDLEHLPLADAMAYLTESVPIARDSTPVIQVTPNLFDRMPLLAARIDVRIDDSRGAAP